MKLRTEMRGFADGTHYAAVKSGDTADAIHHDAAAAHALSQAMEEKASEYSLAALALMIGPIKKRASELMAEWGFDSGEDA